MIIGVFGGTFNPIHIGHCILANYICQQNIVDQVWFVVSPQNPLKELQDASYDQHKLTMVQLALANHSNLNVSDIEYTLPKPSYTITTLQALKEKHPEHSFKLIIGADNWLKFDKWRDYQKIIYEFGVIIYPRLGCDISNKVHPNAIIVNAPIIEISSTFIRKSLKSGKDIGFMVPEKVNEYIKEHKLYGYTE